MSAHEAQSLNKISRLVLGSTREKADVPKAAAEVNQLYHAMVISGTSNAVALAIAGAANASFSVPHLSTTGAVSVTGTPMGTGVGAVVGGVIGGVIGGIVGGGFGAGLGAAIGAAAGGAIGFCNKAGV